MSNNNSIKTMNHQYNTQYKVMMLATFSGSGNGKTTLLHRYIRGSFISSTTTTIGIDFASKCLEVSNSNSGKKDASMVKLKIFDTASQEGYYGIITPFFHSAHCLMFFFDVTHLESFTDLPMYIDDHIVPTLGDESFAAIPKFLIGTKDDLRETHGKVDLDDAQRFATERNMTFLMTSSKTGKNVNEAFQLVAEKCWHCDNDKKISEYLMISESSPDSNSAAQNLSSISAKPTGILSGIFGYFRQRRNTVDNSSINDGSGSNNTSAACKLDPLMFSVDMNEITIKEHLGSGGFGHVMSAEWNRQQTTSDGDNVSSSDNQLDKTSEIIMVALKLVSVTDIAGQLTPERVKMFQEELELGKSLTHPNIMQTYGSILRQLPNKPPQVGIVMQLAEQGSLSDFLYIQHRKSALTVPVKLQILLDIARGCCYLHSMDIIHRDLKPDNVLVDRHGVCLLTDFGLSKQQVIRTVTLTQNMGTSGYMAPEVITVSGSSAKVQYGKAVDVYSFGIIMWVVLTEATASPFPLGIGKNRRPDYNHYLLVDLSRKHHLESVVQLMKECWDEKANKRPIFTKIEKRLQNALDDAIVATQPNVTTRLPITKNSIGPDSYNHIAEKLESSSAASSPQSNTDEGLASGDKSSTSNSSAVTSTNNSTSTTYSSWTVKQVQEWIITLDRGDFAEYAPIFARSKINGRVLANLTDEKLEKCGVDAFGAREAILLARDELI